MAGTASRGSVRNSFVRPISQMRTALSSPAVANREASGLTERLVTLPSCALRLMVDAVAAFQTTTPPSRPPRARSLLEPYARLVLPPGSLGGMPTGLPLDVAQTVASLSPVAAR